MSALGGKAVLAAGSEWEKRAQAGPAIAETENRVRKSKKCTTAHTLHSLSIDPRVINDSENVGCAQSLSVG